MLAAEAMQAKPGMRVLDACAAPGGKACYMAETMQNTGRASTRGSFTRSARCCWNPPSVA